MSRRLILIVIAVIVVGGGVAAWIIFQSPRCRRVSPAATASSKPRRSISPPKYPRTRSKTCCSMRATRIEAGQVVARMDTTALEAQLREAQAQIKQAQDGRDVALAQVRVKQANYDFAAKATGAPRTWWARAPSASRRRISTTPRCWPPRPSSTAPVSVRPTASAIDAAKATADRLQSDQRRHPGLADPGAGGTRLSEPGEVLPREVASSPSTISATSTCTSICPRR